MTIRELLFVAFTLACGLSAKANVTLPAIISDHAVLQMSDRVPIWGKASPSEKVTVTLDKVTASTTADSDGKWKVELNLKEEGQGPYILTVEGTNKLIINDVIIGEVWFCSGQSNMCFELFPSFGGHEEVAKTNNPLFREFLAAEVPAPIPQDDCHGKWELASPGTLGHFTAVGYYFGKKIQAELNVPIGLIRSCIGATQIEGWMSSEAFDTDPDLKAGKEKSITDYQLFRDLVDKYPTWKDKYGRQDHALPTSLDSYINPDVPTTDWKTVKFPAKFTDVGLPDAGAVWLRKKITFPPERINKSVTLFLGEYHDSIAVYVNGKKIRDINSIDENQIFDIPVGESNEMTLALRMFNASSGMEILSGKLNPFKIHWQDKDPNNVPLDGEWLAKVEYDFPPLSAEAQASCPTRALRPRRGEANVATYLFNGMVLPFIPYRIAGVLWYQGEANGRRAFQYRTAFSNMITDWRKKWGQGDFPFYFCQLPNYASLIPEFREAQSTALSLPNTGQAVLIDVGENDNVHPKDKKDVGERLALIALAKTYGKGGVYSGPIYNSIAIEGDAIRITFKNTDGGLIAKPLPATIVPNSFIPDKTLPLVRNTPESELEGFAICGEDKKWVWANAKISGNTVVVSAASVPHPIAVRYAWANNPICNLYNGAYLPAAPFRTDNFPDVTENSKFMINDVDN